MYLLIYSFSNNYLLGFLPDHWNTEMKKSLIFSPRSSASCSGGRQDYYLVSTWCSKPVYEYAQYGPRSEKC